MTGLLMRDYMDRPVYLSKWTNKELIDGMNRPAAYLAACGDSYADLKAEGQKRSARAEANKLSRRKNAGSRRAHDLEVHTRWSRYSLTRPEELSEALGALKSNTASLRAREYQAARVSIHRALARLRGGAPLRGIPSAKVSPFIAFWKICLPSGQDVADAKLKRLLAGIDLKRMVQLGHTPTTAQ